MSKSATAGNIMKDEDLLKCPLLHSLDAMHRAELLGLVNDSCLREQLERCLAQHLQAEGEPITACEKAAEPRNFEKDVHTWNPKRLVFSRSPKE